MGLVPLLVHIFLPICSLLLLFGAGSQGLGLDPKLLCNSCQTLPGAWSGAATSSLQAPQEQLGVNGAEGRGRQGWALEGSKKGAVPPETNSPFLLHHSLRSLWRPSAPNPPMTPSSATPSKSSLPLRFYLLSFSSYFLDIPPTSRSCPPQGLCTCHSFCQNALPPDLCMVHFFHQPQVSINYLFSGICLSGYCI